MPRFAYWLILLIIPLTFCAVLTQVGARGWNDSSRLAAIESLVHRGTFRIDDSQFLDTGDKVLIDQHYYSDKQPFLIVLFSGVYATLRAVFGLDLQEDQARAIYWLCLSSMGGIWIIALFCFHAALGRTDLPEPWRLFLVLSAGVGTTWLTWTTVLNNHAVAASLLMIGLCAYLSGRKPVAPLLTGLLIGIAAMSDLLVIVFVVGFAWLYFISDRRWPNLRWYVLGLLPPVIVAFGLNWHISGDLVPIKLHAEYFDYPGSAFDRDNLSGFLQHDPASFLNYAFHSLFGRSGLFLYNPLLLIAIFGVIWQIMQRGPFRDLAVMFLTCSATVVAYVLIFTANYGGGSYGVRWFVPLIPFACFFSYSYFIRFSPTRGLVYGGLLVCGVLIMLLGSVNPWSRTWMEPHPMKANLQSLLDN